MDLSPARSGVLPVEVCARLCDTLSAAAAFDEALGHIEAARLAVLGPGLLTINLNATEAGAAPDEVHLQRLWSSDPTAYPVAGRKRKTLTPWTEQLLLRGEVFIGQGDAALAEVFDDHALITGLGWHSIVNVPLLRDRRCFATFNVLGGRPEWQAHEVASVRLLALLATPWVLQATASAPNGTSRS